MRSARLLSFLTFVYCASAFALPGAQGQSQTLFPTIQAPQPLPKKPDTAPPPVPNVPQPGVGDQAFAGSPQADPAQSVIIDKVDTLTDNGSGKFIGRGNVHIRYKDYALTSDRMDADMDSGEVLFSGNVLLKSPNGQTIAGGRAGTLALNLHRDTYTILGAHSTIQPEAVSIGIILPIFVNGGTITGRPGLIDARGSTFTTCDFLEPHYSFQARDLAIFPGKRLVARDVTLYRKKKRIITFPYLVVPLDRRFARQTLFPEVGQTPSEGYYIKLALGYVLTSSLPGILRLEAFQKKGLGTGFDQSYGGTDPKSKAPNGTLSLYQLYDRSTGNQNINASLDHRQIFGTIAAALTTQFQENSYYAGQGRSQSLSNQLTLTRDVGNLDTSLRTNLAQSNYGLGQSQTLTSSLDQIFRPTDTERFETKFDYSQFLSPAFSGADSSDRRQLDSNLDYTERGKRFDYELLATKYTQIGSSSGTFLGGLERLPEFRLATDGLRMPLLRQLFSASSHLDLSLGEFNEPASQERTQRARFGLDLGTITKTIDQRNSLDLGGSFQQGFYGDNAAQYVLNGRSAYHLKIGSKSSVGLSYTYLRPYGFTPFEFDFVGSTNATYLNFAYQETPQFQVTLATGYDFNQAHGQYGFAGMPWQNIAAQALFTPNRIFRLRTTTSYDLNHGQFLDLTNAMRIRAAGGFAFDLGSRYEPQQHKFSNISGSLDLPFFRDRNEDAGWRLRAIAGYNGFTSQYEYRGLALTRSWHDWEGSIIYQDESSGYQPGSSISFNFRLKAFPAQEPFAVGQFGQSLESGLGEIY